MGIKKGTSAQELQFNVEVSRRVEKLRAEKGVSRSELARVGGVSPSLLYHYEVGLVRWSVFRLGLIAKFFMLPVDEFLPNAQDYVQTSCETRRDR